VLTLLGGAAAFLSLGASRAGAGRRPKRKRASRQEGLHVASLEDVPETDALQSSYFGLPLLLFRLEGEVKAVSGMCTHEGCFLGWNADRGVILCPCHGGEFDPTGTVLTGPPPAALLRFPVRIDEGQIYVLDPVYGD
jgi:Rieske Fe-S protein